MAKLPTSSSRQGNPIHSPNVTAPQRSILPYLLLVGLALFSVLVFFFIRPEKPGSYAECLEVKGSLTQPSIPAVCITPDGKTFTETTPEPSTLESPNPPGIGTNMPEPTENSLLPLPATEPECMAAGCSGQICVPAAEADDTITTCEYEPEYACVNFSTCEKQADGNCGWTETTAYLQCLEQY